MPLCRSSSSSSITHTSTPPHRRNRQRCHLFSRRPFAARPPMFLWRALALAEGVWLFRPRCRWAMLRRALLRPPRRQLNSSSSKHMHTITCTHPQLLRRRRLLRSFPRRQPTTLCRSSKSLSEGRSCMYPQPPPLQRPVAPSPHRHRRASTLRGTAAALCAATAPAARRPLRQPFPRAPPLQQPRITTRRTPPQRLSLLRGSTTQLPRQTKSLLSSSINRCFNSRQTPLPPSCLLPNPPPPSTRISRWRRWLSS